MRAAVWALFRAVDLATNVVNGGPLRHLTCLIRFCLWLRHLYSALPLPYRAFRQSCLPESRQPQKGIYAQYMGIHWGKCVAQ